MSLETIIVQHGATNLEPRSDISVNKLYYNEIVDPLLQNLIPNSTVPADMTNNFNVIQTALDGGGVINFPPGTYYVNSPLLMEVNQTQLIGAGIDLSIIKAGASFTGDLLSISNPGIPVKNVVLRGLTLDGNAANQTSAAHSCLFLVDAQDCLIEEVKCYCSKDEALVVTTDGDYSFGNRISKCIIQYAVTHGLFFAGTTVSGTSGDVYNNIVSDCIISFSGGNGLYEYKSSRNLVANCQIYRTNLNGILIDNSYECSVSGCVVDRSSRNGVSVTASQSCSVKGSVIQYSNQGNSTYYGINLGATAINGTYTSNSLVEDSTSISDAVTGPNGVSYPAKTITNTQGVILDSTAQKNVISDNFMSSAISTRFSGATTSGSIIYDSNVDSTSYNKIVTLNSGIGLKAASGFALNTRTTATTPVTVTSVDGLVQVNVAGAATVNLPDVTTLSEGGWMCIIKDVSGAASGNNITVAAADLIDGAASKVISTDYGVLRIISNGLTYWTW